MEIRELRDEHREAWDAYAYRSEQSTFFHLAAWKEVMEEALGCRAHYLMATEGDQVQGILPLLHVNSRLSGHYLTSLPGGMCASSDDAAAALVQRAKELIRNVKAKYLILRDGLHRWGLPELVTDEEHCTFRVWVSRDPEEIRRDIKKRARQLTDRGLQEGVEVVTGTQYLDQFYPVYAEAMRNRGTPTYGLDFLRAAVGQFPEKLHLTTVRHQGEVLGGGFVGLFKDTVFCTWSGLLRELYDLYPSHVLYWETLKFGSEHGFQWVDLGRCRRDSGGYTFKKNWGGEPQDLYQQYYLNGISEPPAVGASMEENARYRLFVKVWSKLPLAVTEVVGPQLRRRMPFG